MKIAFLGDMHGNRKFLADYVAPRLAEIPDLDYIVQVGDFGYQINDDESYLDFVAGLFNVPFAFLDGNHDNLNLLRDTYEGKVELTDEGFWMLRPNLFYMPRGCVWTWASQTFMAAGGAVSFDRQRRIDREQELTSVSGVDHTGTLWFDSEELSDAEVEQFKTLDVKVDVLLTHDRPSRSTCAGSAKNDHFDSQIHARRITELMDHFAPQAVIHGHMHDLYQEWVRISDGGYTSVIGLGCDDFHAKYNPDYDPTGSFIVREIPLDLNLD